MREHTPDRACILGRLVHLVGPVEGQHEVGRMYIILAARFTTLATSNELNNSRYKYHDRGVVSFDRLFSSLVVAKEVRGILQLQFLMYY